MTITVPTLLAVNSPVLLMLAKVELFTLQGLVNVDVLVVASVVEFPTLKLVAPVMTGRSLTVTVISSVETHPLASVPVTVYVAVAVGTNDVPFVTPLSHA